MIKCKDVLMEKERSEFSSFLLLFEEEKKLFIVEVFLQFQIFSKFSVIQQSWSLNYTFCLQNKLFRVRMTMALDVFGLKIMHGVDVHS